MANITTCTKCGRAYEEVSEEAANAQCSRRGNFTLADWYRGVIRQERDAETGALLLIFADEAGARDNPFYAIGTPVCCGGYMNGIEIT